MDWDDLRVFLAVALALFAGAGLQLAQARVGDRALAELVRGAEPGGGRVVRGDLIAPRPAEGMLGDGQELDVGEALLDHVGAELLSEFAIVEPLAP